MVAKQPGMKHPNIRTRKTHGGRAGPGRGVGGRRGARGGRVSEPIFSPARAPRAPRWPPSPQPGRARPPCVFRVGMLGCFILALACFILALGCFIPSCLATMLNVKMTAPLVGTVGSALQNYPQWTSPELRRTSGNHFASTSIFSLRFLNLLGPDGSLHTNFVRSVSDS